MILIANIALLGWPLVAMYLFVRLEFPRAIIWSVVLSFLFLPASYGLDFSGLPALDKISVPNLALFSMVLLYGVNRFRVVPPGGITALLFVFLFLGVLLTILSNLDPVYIAGRVLQGTRIYDFLSDGVRTFLVMVPFMVGWQYLSKSSEHLEIAKVLFVIGFFYSLLMLFEVRMSPQLHTRLYGFFPHSFAQQIRDGGFRPVVFLGHGLMTAFFAMTLTAIAAILWRQVRFAANKVDLSGLRPARQYLMAAAYFGVVLVLCKSIGSLILGCLAVPLILFTRPRTQVMVAAVLAVLAVTYPALRGAKLVPLDDILGVAMSISEERHRSLSQRFTNEERLLNHAQTRPIFGWGGWGRNRVYDPVTGRDITVTDGYWTIVISSFGWVGYVATFGLLGMPIFLIWWRSRRQRENTLMPVTSGLCLLLAINMIELLPNATLFPWTWLIAGALLGYAMAPEEEAADPQTDTSGAVVEDAPRTVI